MTAITMDKIANVLRARHPKKLARITRRHPRTVSRWQAGEGMGADDLVTLMAADAAIFADIVRLAGRADVGAVAVAEEHLRAALAAIGGGDG